MKLQVQKSPDSHDPEAGYFDKPSEFRAQVLRFRRDEKLWELFDFLSQFCFKPMIQNLASIEVSSAQAANFKSYRPLRQQSDNLEYYLESFRRYVDSIRKREAAAKSKEDATFLSNTVTTATVPQPPIDPVHTVHTQKRHLEIFINEQTVSKTLSKMYNFLRLRGHKYNNAINLPD